MEEGEKRYCRNVEVGRVEVGMGGDRCERRLEESAGREEEGGGVIDTRRPKMCTFLQTEIYLIIILTETVRQLLCN